MIRPLAFKDVEAQLKRLGYSLLDLSVMWSGGCVEKSYGYELPIDPPRVPLPPHLPVERVRRGLLDFGASTVSGRYLASVASVRGESGEGEVTSLSFHFHCTFTAEMVMGATVAKAEARLSAPMDAPFPHGHPTECAVQARLLVGPIPMGRGQKARAAKAVAETLKALPHFVAEFPEAAVIALLETRGGRGGWKPKVAWHRLGQLCEVLEVAHD